MFAVQEKILPDAFAHQPSCGEILSFVQHPAKFEIKSLKTTIQDMKIKVCYFKIIKTLKKKVLKNLLFVIVALF